MATATEAQPEQKQTDDGGDTLSHGATIADPVRRREGSDRGIAAHKDKQVSLYAQLLFIESLSFEQGHKYE